MKIVLFYAITLWLGLWGQMTTHYLLGGTGLAVSWLLVASLFFGLERGPVAGQLIGAVWGLFLDAAGMGSLGLHAALFAVAGYTAGMLRRQLDGAKSWTQAIFTGLVSVAVIGSAYGLDHLFSRSPRPFSVALVTEPLANALLAPLIFSLLRRWVAFWQVFPLQED